MYLSIFLLFWPSFYLYNYKKKNIPDKINNNYLSFFHSIIITILSGYFFNNNLLEGSLKDLIYNFSSSYFIYDSTKILIQKRWNDIAYIYHHFVCVYMLSTFNNGIDVHLISKILYIGEMSNFFNYIVYYMIKLNYSKNNIKIMKTFQLLWFSYYRVYYFTSILITDFTKFNDRLLVWFMISIYIMGLLWGWGQVKSYIKG